MQGWPHKLPFTLSLPSIERERIESLGSRPKPLAVQDGPYGAHDMTKSPFDTLMEISMGFTLPRALHVIAELGVADALEETPRSVKAHAAATETDADALNRVLRLLSAHNIFEGQGGVYAHTPISIYPLQVGRRASV
jgi:hypothetical protein